MDGKIRLSDKDGPDFQFWMNVDTLIDVVHEVVPDQLVECRRISLKVIPNLIEPKRFNCVTSKNGILMPVGRIVFLAKIGFLVQTKVLVLFAFCGKKLEWVIKPFFSFKAKDKR